jgi:hypothetical protein
MKRWIVYWNCQDTVEIPPWPLCAGHRDTTVAPLVTEEILAQLPEGLCLRIEETTDGICALSAFGNCCDDPVECIPQLDVSLLNREE